MMKSLLAILKKNLIDSQMMELSNEIEEIQSMKPKIIVDSGFASNPQDALGKTKRFCIRTIIIESYRSFRKSRFTYYTGNQFIR